MNAYELAKKLNEYNADGFPVLIVEQASNMLRQQADKINNMEQWEKRYLDRIADLEKLLQESAMHNISVTSQADEHYARVKELEKDLYMIQRHYDQLETFSPSGKNAQGVSNADENLQNGKV